MDRRIDQPTLANAASLVSTAAAPAAPGVSAENDAGISAAASAAVPVALSAPPSRADGYARCDAITMLGESTVSGCMPW
jgi:hypothetical protein